MLHPVRAISQQLALNQAPSHHLTPREVLHLTQSEVCTLHQVKFVTSAK